MADNLRDWSRGSRLSAAHLQEPITILRKFMSRPNSGFAQLSNQSVRPVFDLHLGKIVATGPASEADYTDERYWVKPQYIVGTNLTSDQITTGDIPAPTIPDNSDGSGQTVDDILTVTSLPEVDGHSHHMRAGELVLYLGIYDWQDQSKLHYVMIPSLPTPQYEFQVYMGVGNNKAGFALPEAHPILPT